MNRVRPLYRSYFIGIGLLAALGATAAADELPDAGVDAGVPVVEPVPPAPPTESTDVPATAHKKKHKHDDEHVAGEAAASVDVTSDSADDKATKKKKRKKLELTGRIFARAALVKLEGAPDTTGQTSLKSARAGLDYRSSHGLRAQLELEVAIKPRIKDAYVQLRLAGEPKLDVRAGNFKMPFSAIELESIWTLPMADRGLIDNVLTKRLQVSGRAVGAMLILAPGGQLHPELRAGIFQGHNDAGDSLAAPAGEGFGQDAVLRASIRPARGVQLGMSGSARAGALIEAPPVIEHAYAGELDLVLDRAVGSGRLRAWVEAMIGTSWLVGGTLPGHDRTRFLETRAIAAYRLGSAVRGERYFEIYGLGGVIDPDRIIERDHVGEVAAGITYGAHDLWRLQVEGEAWRFGDNAPLGIAQLAVLSKDSTTVLVQLGAHL